MSTSKLTVTIMKQLLDNMSYDDIELFKHEVFGSLYRVESTCNNGYLVHAKNERDAIAKCIQQRFDGITHFAISKSKENFFVCKLCKFYVDNKTHIYNEHSIEEIVDYFMTMKYLLSIELLKIH